MATYWKNSCSLIKKNSIKAKWGKLKRRLSIEVDHIDSVSFDDNELLPDELEYIEGGDIVHAELAHSPSYDASKHTLGTLVEEKELKSSEPKSSEQKSSEDKSNNALSLLRSRLTRTTSHDSPLLPRQASKTVETKMQLKKKSNRFQQRDKPLPHLHKPS